MLILAVPETMTTSEDPSDNVTSSSTIQADTVSHVSPTSATNAITASGFDRSLDRFPDLPIIKMIVISLSMAVMAIVMITVAVLVAVVAVMWRRRHVRQKNSASTTMVEIESQKCYCNANAEFNMNDNVSYNIGDSDTLSHHYEYPDLSTTVLDESNIYDSIESQ